MDNLKELLGKMNGGIVLDVGTGDGSFIRLLINNLKDYEKMIGIDKDSSILKGTKENFSDDSFYFEVMSGDKLNYKDNTFDTVSISNSLHHLEDIRQTLSEMLRVLKPGGNFIINELVCDGLNEKQLLHLGLHHLQAELDTILGITHNKCLRREEIISIADSLGLQQGKVLIHENEMFNKYVQINKLEERYHCLLDKITEHPLYENYLAQYNQLFEQIKVKGIEFQSQFLYVGKKSSD